MTPISEAEAVVMEVLWQQAPRSADDVVAALAHRDWAEPTIKTLLNRLGVDDDEATAFIKSDTLARTVMQLRAGKRVVAQTDDNGELIKLSATLDGGTEVGVLFTEIVENDFDQGAGQGTEAALRNHPLYQRFLGALGAALQP